MSLRPLVALLFLAPALAGCLSSATPPGEDLEDHARGGRSLDETVDQGETNEVTRRDPAVRWHYHNYWGTNPTLVLLHDTVDLPLVDADDVTLSPRTPGASFRLPHGALVPPETGEINVTITFTPHEGVPFTGLNFSYRPAGATTFTTVPVMSGEVLTIPVSYDQTDVPHRGSSAWRFRLDPADQQGTAFANGTADIHLEARIGRPLLIDPPHFDQWRGRTILPLVAASVNASVVKVADDRYAEAGADGVATRRAVADLPLPNGSLVPLGTSAVKVEVTWNTSAGSAPPTIRYLEENRPSNATLTPDVDEEGRRLFTIPIIGGMVDSPYTNQSTWRFEVLIDGDAGSVLVGDVYVTAWAQRRA